jgi:hypothetical protein
MHAPPDDGQPPPPERPDPRAHLRADCANCFGLCCVALSFTASADFAIDKPAEQPCTHLDGSYHCGIHTDLRRRGFPGCAAFDCLGAGQRVSQATFGGRSWRDSPETARRMFAVFPVMRHLHETAWYLTESLELPAARTLHDELRAELDRTERLAAGPPAQLLNLDIDGHRRTIGRLLGRVSALARGRGGRALEHADLTGADLRGRDLSRAGLRGALLIGANLTGANLTGADLLGADLRGAALGGADLTGALFVIAAQTGAAGGDARTRLPAALTRPAHWG